MVFLPHRVMGGGWVRFVPNGSRCRPSTQRRSFDMLDTTSQNGVAIATNTTNGLLNDLFTVGTIINHGNRDMILELFGDRIVAENPPKDILLPNGFALTSWSMSLLNVGNKFLERFGVEKAMDIALQVIQSFLPYAPFATAVKDKDGDIVNIILTFKSTSDTNLVTMAESLANTDITTIKSMVNLNKVKLYSFKERAYLMLDGTKISAE